MNSGKWLQSTKSRQADTSWQPERAGSKNNQQDTIFVYLERYKMSDKDNNTKSPRKITLKRKTHTELQVETTPGQARTVAVEVRKKRTYVKRNAEEARSEERRVGK